MGIPKPFRGTFRWIVRFVPDGHNDVQIGNVLRMWGFRDAPSGVGVGVASGVGVGVGGNDKPRPMAGCVEIGCGPNVSERSVTIAAGENSTKLNAFPADRPR